MDSYLSSSYPFFLTVRGAAGICDSNLSHIATPVNGCVFCTLAFQGHGTAGIGKSHSQHPLFSGGSTLCVMVLCGRRGKNIVVRTKEFLDPMNLGYLY